MGRPVDDLKKPVMIVGAIALGLGILVVIVGIQGGDSDLGALLMIGGAVAVGSFFGISQVVGPMLGDTTRPNVRDTESMRERKMADYASRTAVALEKLESQPTKGDSTNPVTEQIKQLASLRDAGILTEEEFQTKKTALLSRL